MRASCPRGYGAHDFALTNPGDVDAKAQAWFVVVSRHHNFGGRIDFDATQRVVQRALELGVNFVDSADTYGNRGGSEECLGRILGEKRKQVVLATKFGMPMDDAASCAALRGAMSWRRWRQALSGLRPTGSTFISCTGPMRRLPSRRRCARLMTSLRQARSASSAARIFPQANSRKAHPPSHTGTAWLHSCRLPGRGQSFEARHRTRVDPRSPDAWHGNFAVFPARERLPHGKVPARRPAAASSRLAKNPRHAGELINERNWRVVEALSRVCRAHAATRFLSLHSAGSLRDPGGRKRHCRRNHAAADRAECRRGWSGSSQPMICRRSIG